MTGQTISHYRILEKLGEGGMGSVYKAEDTKLRRTVALKFLPPDNRDRFLREAQAAASLNHNNICTLFEIDEEHGFLALELIDGPSLKDRIAARPLPLDEALDIAQQACAGLAAAHEKGIIHRDIKPANLMLTAQGQVRIMDFGLAQIGDRTRITKTGSSLGTPAYMSPEQAKGDAVDRRTDIWSVGVVLYEMIGGRPPFRGDTEQAVSYGIVHAEPEPLTAVRSGLPRELDRIAAKTLAKSPAERYQSVADLLVDLRRLRGPAVRPPGRKRLPVAWIAAVAALLALASAAVWYKGSGDDAVSNPFQGARFTRLTDYQGDELDAAISPDGRMVAFLSNRDGWYEAMVGQIGSGDFVNLSKGKFPSIFHEQIRSVGFSDDGANVWLRIGPPRSMRGIWFIPVLGGVPSLFLPDALTVGWSPEGSRLVYHTSADGDPAYLAARDRSQPRLLFQEVAGRHCHLHVWSPDGRYLYFVRGVPPNDSDIWRIGPDGGQPERITTHNADVRDPVFIGPRTLVYTVTSRTGVESSLHMIDVERRRPLRLNHGIEQYLSVSASRDGRRLVATVANPISTLWTVPIASAIVPETQAGRIPLPNVSARAPRYGAGGLLYLSSQGGSERLWRLREGAAAEIWSADGVSLAAAPAASPDGSLVAVPATRGDNTVLYVVNSDGTSPRVVADSVDARTAPSFSPDGKFIAGTSIADGIPRVVRIPVEGGANQTMQPIAKADPSSRAPVWSPDGNMIVYYARPRGVVYEVKAVTPAGQPLPLPAIEVLGDRDQFRFLPDGRGLVVLQGGFRQQNFWLLEFATGKLRQLTDLQRGYMISSFDVSPDGKSIVFDRFRENSDIVLIEPAQSRDSR